jgi:hypothetical protein
MKWIHHYSKLKDGGNILLIYDRTKSHFESSTVQVTEKNYPLFCLPSNCLYELQTLDKNVYKPFKDFWVEAVLTHWTTKGVRTITRMKWAYLFSEGRFRVTIPSNFPAGLKNKGIYTLIQKQYPNPYYLFLCRNNLGLFWIQCHNIMIFWTVHLTRITLNEGDLISGPFWVSEPSEPDKGFQKVLTSPRVRIPRRPAINKKRQ